MSLDYEQVAEELQRAKPVRDLSELWNRLTPVEKVGGTASEAIARFCASKGISTAALAAQDARVAAWGGGPDLMLAFPGSGAQKGAVTGIRYRSLGNGRRSAESGSTVARANVIGDWSSPDWFVTEGETDAARIWDLVGDAAAILVLPGALSSQRSWFNVVPRGATLYLCHDSDEAGDKGAAKVSKMTGGTIRLRPPVGFKDWCMWPGTREEFISLVIREKRRAFGVFSGQDEYYERWATERTGERMPVRLGFGSLDADLHGISDGQVLGIAARTAVGKTWMLASIVNNIAAAGHGSAIFSLEMPGIEWFERQWAIYDGVSTQEIEARATNAHPRPVEFLKRMENTLLCERSFRLDEATHLLAEARNKLAVPLRCVYIDYLGLLGYNGRDAYERASGIGRGMKELAKEEHVAVIVAMQLSRAGGGGANEVTLEMMRDSGVIEESMDFILGCWRPIKDSQSLSEFDKATLQHVLRTKIIKNRKGNDGRVVDLQFHQPSMKVMEIAPG